MSVHFTQPCPTCGRRVQIQASLLGCTVACQHCKGEFVAEAGLDREAAEGILKVDEASDPLMVRVQRALQRADSGTVVS